MKLLARYPNNTKLLDSEVEDKFGNTKLLAFENGDLLSNEKVSGVVYINEQVYEVYSGKDLNRTGLFVIGQGFDWDAETPRQKHQRAYDNFRKRIQSETESLNELCYCSFPRIVDYIENRESDDSRILKQNLQHKFLVFQDSYYDEANNARASIMICKVCNSEYVWKYRERGIDSISIKSNKAMVYGKPVLSIAPNYLKALFDDVFCRKSYLDRSELVRADLETTIDYLFKKELT